MSWQSPAWPCGGGEDAPCSAGTPQALWFQAGVHFQQLLLPSSILLAPLPFAGAVGAAAGPCDLASPAPAVTLRGLELWCVAGTGPAAAQDGQDKPWGGCHVGQEGHWPCLHAPAVKFLTPSCPNHCCWHLKGVMAWGSHLPSTPLERDSGWQNHLLPHVHPCHAPGTWQV